MQGGCVGVGQGGWDEAQQDGGVRGVKGVVAEGKGMRVSLGGAGLQLGWGFRRLASGSHPQPWSQVLQEGAALSCIQKVSSGQRMSTPSLRASPLQRPTLLWRLDKAGRMGPPQLLHKCTT